MNKAEINAMLVASLGSSKKHMVGSKIGYGAQWLISSGKIRKSFGLQQDLGCLLRR